MRIAITLKDGKVVQCKSLNASYTVEDGGAVSVWVNGERVFSVAAGEWVSAGEAKTKESKS